MSTHGVYVHHVHKPWFLRLVHYLLVNFSHCIRWNVDLANHPPRIQLVPPACLHYRYLWKARISVLSLARPVRQTSGRYKYVDTSKRKGSIKEQRRTEWSEKKKSNSTSILGGRRSIAMDFCGIWRPSIIPSRSEQWFIINLWKFHKIVKSK